MGNMLNSIGTWFQAFLESWDVTKWDQVDWLFHAILIGGGLAIIGILWSYYRGLRESPRDMWLLFIYKFIEYTVYAAMNMAVILWLSRDCGLGDIEAGSFISGWSIMLSVIAMIAGALVDTIGIRKTLLISVVFLAIARFFMSWVTNPYAVFILGFVPMAIGFAIVGPLVSVAIKRYTTKEGAAVGFGLFYVVMNLAYAAGARLFDDLRSTYVIRDAAGKIINENAGTDLLGMHFSTYQMFFVIGLVATVTSVIIVIFIRDGVSVTDDGRTIITPLKNRGSGLAAVKYAARDTAKLINSVFREKYFWIFVGMLSLTLFVRFIFFHFHYTFPKYGVRILGEGSPIGNIYGFLNPVLIVFLVPFVAFLTKKTSSYKMLIIGSAISSLSCFLAAIPPSAVEWLTNTTLGELVFVKWLDLAPNMAALMADPPTADYWGLIIFITVFTIGEAIWSPRLMQFTAEIAPKGKEGTYIALSILPFFAAKFAVGPMSGILLEAYTPLNSVGKVMAGGYPDHYMIWVWIGGMALITPIALLLMRNLFQKALDGGAIYNAPDEEPTD